MKKANVLILIMFNLLMVGCSSDDESTQKNNVFISPKGFKLAVDKTDFKQRYKLEENFSISNIIYHDGNAFSAAEISYFNSKNELQKFIVVEGKFSTQSNKVIYLNDDSNKAKIGENPTRWIVKCGGCENCGPRSTLSPDGEITFQCGSGQTCCFMTIERSIAPQ